MFNPQLGQALFEILPSEVSSSIAYQDSQGTEAKKNHALESLRHGMTSTHLDT
jgi:hypothetical protein